MPLYFCGCIGHQRCVSLWLQQQWGFSLGYSQQQHPNPSSVPGTQSSIVWDVRLRFGDAFLLLAEIPPLEAFFWKVCALVQLEETVFWKMEACK